MRTLFHPTFLHPPGGDPGVFVDLPDEGTALLLDLPPLEHVPPRKLLRVGHALVTHTHMDHFAGFDHLLRVSLRRADPLTVTGPPGFLAAVRGRVASYAWNLIAGYPVRLIVQEWDGGTIRREAYAGASGMNPEPLPTIEAAGAIHATRAYRVEVAALDHGIPVLGAAVREVEHLAVNRDRLVRRGLAPGAWLRALKDAIRRGDPAHATVEALREDGSVEARPLGELTADLIVRGPGQAIAYLTDLAATEENLEKARALARGADLLICEAAFLDADGALAAERRHLTARQTGELARGAGAKRLAVFHLSPRYQGREREVLDEAAEAFGGPLEDLPGLGPMAQDPG